MRCLLGQSTLPLPDNMVSVVDSINANVPLIVADQVSRSYAVSGGWLKPDATVHALSDASFELHAGKTLAVVGESGCGKSTLARVLSLIEPPSFGSFVVDGVQIDAQSGAPANALRAAISIVFQDPYGSLNPRQKIGQILQEPLIINKPDASKQQREQASRQMLELVGLRPEHYDRYPHMFSGGQRQRIAIARALMLEPKILVLDEPVSALDLSIQSQILNLLVELQDRLNLAYLFISHDLSVVRHIADDVMVMYLGRVVEKGVCRQVFEYPRHPYTQALVSATPVADPSRRQQRIRLEGELPSPLNPPDGCAFNPRCPLMQSTCTQHQPKLQALSADSDTNAPSGQLVACHFPLDMSQK